MLSMHKSLIVIAAFGYAAFALAEAPPPSKEAREKMAQAHEKMAACLRSERDIGECRSEMMKSCKEDMGEHGCKMGMMGEHHGRSDKPATASKPSDSKPAESKK